MAGKPSRALAVVSRRQRVAELFLQGWTQTAIAEHGKVRLVYVLGPEFDDYEGDAVWEDIKLGARHPADFERIAIVTDGRWARPATKVISLLFPGKARAFGLDELGPAKAWAAAENN